MKKLIFASQIIFLFIGLLMLAPSIQAVPIPKDMPVDKVDDLVIYAEGDEHFCQFYTIGPDNEKHTMVKGSDGKWSYADLKPTGSVSQAIEEHLQEFNQAMDEVNAQHLKTLKENQAAGQKTVYQIHTIFVEFPGTPHTYEANQFLSMLYSNRSDAPYNQTPEGYTAYGSVRDYWDEVSRGQVGIQPITHYPTEGQWFMMPQTREYYAGDYLDHIEAFLTDLSAVTGLNFATNEKWVLVLAGDAMYAGTIFYPSSGTPPFSNYITLLTERFHLFRGPEPQFYFLAMGIAAHEFGHLLFGLPDYAYSTSYWDIMGMGLYGYGDQQTPNPEKPVHPSAIARVRAGFADVQTLSGEGIVRFLRYNLPNVETTGKILHLDNQDNDTNFYLEVRQPYNNVFDSDITGNSAGLVVWFTFRNSGRYFPYPGYPFYPEKVGYFNATRGSCWSDVTLSTFPGQNHNTEIGYDTAPPFIGNNYTSLHHLANLRKDIKSISAETPEGEESIVNRFSINFDLERRYFNEKISIVSLDDDNNGMSQGNDNGFPEVGERIEVVFKIENIGAQIIPAMQGSFDTDSDVQCLTADFPIEEIPTGSFVQTPTIVFNILSPPITGNFHAVRFLFDGKFIINLPIKLSFDLPNIPIATGPYAQVSPAISGDKIVWVDIRNGNDDIYLYDLNTNTERQITTNLAYQGDPAIYGDKIVWRDNRNVNANIYLYDLSTNTERQITNNSADQVLPAISGDKIAWEDNRNGNYDIYLYDLTTNTERQITYDTSNQRLPAISGDKIVWVDIRNGNYDIYLYDLTTNTEQQITYNTVGQSYPAISGDKIVWMDIRNGNYDIYLYDLNTNTEQQITYNTAEQLYPAISGDEIVWVDIRNGNEDIYLYDLTTNTERQITTHTARQVGPNISGDKIVWQDLRNGNYDIYLGYVP